ncbi:MAG: glycosyltransferase family 2 protein [Caldicoprobacterales bacterium]
MISVIIPCYNASLYIIETLESLEKQTYTDFEVLCINDGSTDNTLELLENYQRNSKLKITILSQANLGVSSARNRGIDKANGEYIAFLDADDIYHPRFLELLSSAIGNMDTAYCRLTRDLTKLTDREGKVTVKNQQQAMEDLLYNMGQFGFYCYLYRKDILNNRKIRFTENAKYGEDREFIWKYMVNCKNAIFVDAKLYGYRFVKDSVANTVSWRKTDLLECVKRIEQYMVDNSCLYYSQFKNYMYPRSMWAVAKSFAVGKRQDYYNRLLSEYDVDTSMKYVVKFSNQLYAKVLAAVFLVSPKLFYRLLSIYKY